MKILCSDFDNTLYFKDDILSFTGDEKLLGKPIGNDKIRGKCTFVTLFGLNGAQEKLEKYIMKLFGSDYVYAKMSGVDIQVNVADVEKIEPYADNLISSYTVNGGYL